jgi:hypothetical protein
VPFLDVTEARRGLNVETHGFTEADAPHLNTNSNDEINYLIDRISRRDRAR